MGGERRPEGGHHFAVNRTSHRGDVRVQSYMGRGVWARRELVQRATAVVDVSRNARDHSLVTIPLFHLFANVDDNSRGKHYSIGDTVA